MKIKCENLTLANNKFSQCSVLLPDQDDKLHWRGCANFGCTRHTKVIIVTNQINFMTGWPRAESVPGWYYSFRNPHICSSQHFKSGSWPWPPPAPARPPGAAAWFHFSNSRLSADDCLPTLKNFLFMSKQVRTFSSKGQIIEGWELKCHTVVVI